MFGRRQVEQPDRQNGLRTYVVSWERGLYQTLQRNDVACLVVDKVRGPQVFTFRLKLADPGNLGKLLTTGEQLALTIGVPSVRLVRHSLQAYIMRRMLAQDDDNDLKPMLILARPMGSRTPNVNVRLPEQQQGTASWPMLMAGQASPPAWSADGSYRDTIAASDIEIE